MTDPFCANQGDVLQNLRNICCPWKQLEDRARERECYAASLRHQADVVEVEAQTLWAEARMMRGGPRHI